MLILAASVVVAIGIATGTLRVLDEGRGTDRARPEASDATLLLPMPDVPALSNSPSVKESSSSARPKRTAAPSGRKSQPTATASPRLYRHPDSQVLDWVRAHPDDPRTDVIASRIADEPAAVWFADFTPSTITSRVRAVTSGAAARGRVPVVVPYAIPERDCGGASEGGAPDFAAYDGWIDDFAAGLGSGEVVVILEPDSVAQTDCLSDAQRADRFAALARAGRVLKAADPKARVYYDAGHSDWNPAAQQAALLRQAGAASAESSDGIFSNVSNFNGTSAEIAYDRQVLDALGGPAGLGAVVDTSRNGNGAPADGQWCDPTGRKIGRAPTLNTGEARIDGYLWVKLPGESDGCKGAAGAFTASYAYDLAR
ncbi:glycoside hydrolase family 6 protein [Streptomyces sp. NPDC005492]|uniref:glycoside hydrolase family 6 protein n=1 Tax=Streptomyces sp. NPDC005492 TaxID=3156883 RepID=UPI0033BE4434